MRLVAVAAALILCGATAMGAVSPQPEGRAETSVAVPPTRQPQILILATDDFTRPWVQLTVDGFRDVVLKQANPPVLSFETLDAPRFDGPEYAEQLRAWWRYKYRDRHFDLIVALGEETVRLLAEHDGDPWPQTPVLFTDIGGVRVDTARHLPHAEGIIFDEHFKAALGVVKSILPATTHVALIRGASLTESDRWDSFDESVRTAGLGLAPIVLAGLSLEDLLSKVAHLPDHTVIYILAPTIDARGRVLPQDLACELISSASAQPAFSMPAQDLGCGIVGGLLRDFSRVGRLVGEQALRTLQTHTSESTTVASARYTTLAFDARQLARWGIEEARLPAGSTVQYRQPSIWRDHRTLIIVSASVAGLQAFLIAGLLFEHQRRRRAEVTSRQHLATMAHLDRRVAMGELTSSLAHELNQPLNAILQNAGAAEMMLAKMGSDRDLDEVRAILVDIRTDNVRAGQTIHRMRSLLSKRELQTESLDMNDVARDTIALVSPDAAARHVRVESDLGAMLDPVMGDRIHLQQVLLNLILNGMEAMATTPRDRRALLIRTSQVKGDVEVSVRDSGTGLSSLAATQLFEPFYTTKGDGMGMGLSIVRTIIEAHAGRIEAGNNAAGGATFTFHLKAFKGPHAVAQ